MPLSYDALVDKLAGLIDEVVDAGGQKERTRAYYGVEVVADPTNGPAPNPPAGYVRVKLEGTAQLARFFGAMPTITAPDYVDVLMIGENVPIVFLNRSYGAMGPHALLDNHIHPDTAVIAPLRGSLVVADATPEWNRVVHPGAAGYALTTDANDTVWDQTPTWTGLHTYDAGGLVGTGQDWDPFDASGQDLGDATHRWDLHTQVVTFGGGTGTNITYIPDNLAEAWKIRGADNLQYLVIATTDVQPLIVFNDASVDVDFIVGAVGAITGLKVQGSDGQITLGVLGAGAVQSTAGGVLSSGALPLTDLASYTQGDLIYGGAADWQDLAHPGAANCVLQSTAAQVGWSANAVTFPTAGAVPVGSGVNTQVAYWTAASTLAGDAGLTYNAATDTLSLANSLTFTGATGVNDITVPDNLAIALTLEDAGGLEYMRTVSANAQPAVVFNEGGADIDFRIEGVGIPNALFVRGSDGYIGLNKVPIYPFDVTRSWTIAAPSIAYLVTANVQKTITGAANQTNPSFAPALVAQSNVAAGYSATISTLGGIIGDVTVQGGTVTTAVCHQGLGRATAGATITSLIVFWNTSYNAGGTVVNSYLLYDGNAAIATTLNYGLYLTHANNRNYLAGHLAVGGTDALTAQLLVDQSSADAAIPVAIFDQADVDQDMFEFITTIGVGNAIEAVGGKTLTTTHFIKVTLPGALTRYFPVGTIA